MVPIPFHILDNKAMTRLSAAVMVAFLCVPIVVYGQEACGKYNEIINRLKTKYSEQVVGRGIDGMGRMVEILAGPTGWTVLLTRPNGIACVATTGKRGTTWEVIVPTTGDSVRQ